jgi:hypothetical protein
MEESASEENTGRASTLGRKVWFSCLVARGWPTNRSFVVAMNCLAVTAVGPRSAEIPYL